MRFFIDNNLSPRLASGMRAFGENVEHLRDKFKPNAKDIDWLKYIGENNLFLITKDEKIRHHPFELAELKKYGIGTFLLGGKNKNHWDIVEQLVRNWRRIKEHADKERRPFAIRVPPSGTKFVKIPID